MKTPEPTTETVPIVLNTPPQIVFIGNGSFGPQSHAEYLLPDSWAIHLYNYSANLEFIGIYQHELHPGMIGITPPGVPVKYRWHEPNSTHAAAHFQWPVNSGSRRPAMSRDSALAQRIPILVDFHDQFAGWHDQFQAAIGYYPVSPRRAEALLWMLLWAMVEHAPRTPTPGARHPDLVDAIGYIERHLGNSISVADVVSHVAMSHNQLTRLFQQDQGTSIVGYIRRRRGQRALRLLQDTSLPIKSIAIDVGVPDLQQFNKLIRREHNQSPRQIRHGKKVLHP